jgi:hypothetical protein
VGEQDANVAAETGNGVGPAQDTVQARADLAQQEIARVVPERVVDPEPVEVDQEERRVGRGVRSPESPAGAVAKGLRLGSIERVARVVRRALGVLLQPSALAALLTRWRPAGRDGVEPGSPITRRVEPVGVGRDRSRDGA